MLFFKVMCIVSVYFDILYVDLVEIGEMFGNLFEVFECLVIYCEKSE